MTAWQPWQQWQPWQFWIDRGGTFTDVVGRRPDGTLVTHKLLSENPGRYRDAAVAGMRHVLGLQADEPITPDLVSGVKMGTTVATNALLERTGEPTVLVTTDGFGEGIGVNAETKNGIAVKASATGGAALVAHGLTEFSRSGRYSMAPRDKKTLGSSK